MGRFSFFVVAVAFGAILAGCSDDEGGKHSGTAAIQSERVPDVELPSLEGRNLVVIVADSLRADHVGAYGYSKPTTPFIDSLAERGIVFERASANSSFIAQSLSALFSGRLPTAGGTIGMLEAHPLDETPTLPQFFADADYYTGVVSNQSLIRGKGFTKGFEEVQIGSMESAWDGMEVSKRALEFVEDAADDPFFLYVHYLDPHHPYRPPAEYAGRFVSDDMADPLDVGEFRSDYAAVAESLAGEDDPQVQALVARYDAEIAYTDACIRRLVEGLGERGAAEDTVIIVTSNHGEEFLDHGYIGNAWTLYEELLHVPLIVFVPGEGSGMRVPTRVSLVDVAPTVAALFGLDGLGANFEGESLFAGKGSGYSFDAPVKPRIAELVIPQRVIVRSVTQGDWKYVAASRWEYPEDRQMIGAAFAEITRGLVDGSIPTSALWGASAHEALYDLGRDPEERNNRVSDSGEVLVVLREALADYARHCEEEGLSAREMTGSFEALDQSEIENLESLGYL